jgi:carotenoid cleavage dioxygenase
MFDLLLRLDCAGGPPQALPLDQGMCYNEPVHVPSREAGHEGWLVMVVDRQTGPDSFEHECWIVNAGDIAAGPVARVKIPCRLRPQVHGWWVSAEQLAAA